MAQFLLIALVLILELKEYFIARSHQLAPHIAGSNETGQAFITVMVAIEFLFHPLSLFLLYLALEGAVRFLGSLITAEIVPSLLAFLFFKISGSASRSIRRRSSGPLLADALDLLSDGRIRIASASPKVGWNASITIGIDGQWFELECEQRAQPPRSVIYVLRPSPAGKILRGYQEYDTAGALTASLATQRSKEADAS